MEKKKALQTIYRILTGVIFSMENSSVGNTISIDTLM
jgi:hypothetical protein